MPAGALIGDQVGGLLMPRMGRKGGMMMCAAMFSVSLLVLAAAADVVMIYLGRLLCGVCTGRHCLVVSNPNMF